MKKKINQKKNKISIILLTLPWLVLGCQTKNNHEKVLPNASSMTLEQKAQLVTGTGFYLEMPDSIRKMMPNGFNGEIDSDDSAYVSMVKRIRKILPGASGISSEFKSLGITPQVLTDGPAGLRIQPTRKGDDKKYFCTAFPIATSLASTWDTTLVHSVGQAMGNEVKEYGSDILLAPAMNIQRDPLCGRNFEYYSEDPRITGKIAAAMVKGIQSNGVGTSVKHFAANNSETQRLSVNTIVSERALREIYLRGFEIAIKESQPWTVMSSYNKINGTYASENHDLLTKILRDDWGFQGYVMTDWGGGSDAVAQMKAGNDMIQPGQGKQIRELVAAVNDGKLDIKILDKNVSRILKIMLKTPHYSNYQYADSPDMKAHALVCRQAGADGMVLLENRGNGLPIKSGIKSIAAFGTTSYDFISGGTGSGDVNEAYTVSLIEGLLNGGYQIDNDLQNIYKKYIKEATAKRGPSRNPFAFLGGKEPVPEMSLTKLLTQKMAEKTDMALVTIGRNSGEGFDRMATAGDFYLTLQEKEMIKNVSDAFHAKKKKAVVILNIGGVIETASWSKIPDAVLLAWQPGQEAGNSVVDVLSGRVNPSGKLAVTFPISYSDAPTAKNFPGVAVKSDKIDKGEDQSGFSLMNRAPWEIIYQEGIFVGYRYYNTFNKRVAYEFGYGMSYTNFEFSDLKVTSTAFDGRLTGTVVVKNTGQVAGREVVQVYINSPKGKLDKPKDVLVYFAKTKLLEQGESQTVGFTFTTKDIASFNEANSSWIAEAGIYTLKIGESSLKIRQTATFELPGELTAGKVSKALAPTREIKWMQAK